MISIEQYYKSINGCYTKYKSVDKFDEILSYISDLTIKEDIDGSKEQLVDIIVALFPTWYAQRVRREMNSIRKKMNKVQICELCGQQTNSFEVHHIISPFDLGGNELENLQILCKKCHKQTFKAENINNN